MSLRTEHVNAPDEIEIADDAVPDPHYLELLNGTRLPQAYLPSRMPGPQKTWIKVASVALIGIFLLATVCGVCLTYGPHVG